MTDSLNSDMFDTVASMVTAAPVVLSELPVLAAARMLFAVKTIILALEDNGFVDEFLRQARVDFDRESTLAMSDPAAFRRWVGELSARFTVEAAARELA